MQLDDDVLGLIGQIYDCVVDPNRWTTTLKRIGGRFKSQSAAINIVNPLKREVRFLASCNVTPDIMAAFDQGNKINPVITSGWFANLDEPYTTATYLGDESYRKTRFYREVVAPMGFEDAILTVVAKSSNRFGALVFARRADDGPVVPQDLAEVRIFAPHIRRAVTITDMLDAKALREDALSRAMDLLTVGVVLTDGDGRIVYANRFGDRLLREKTALRRDGDRLSANDPKAAADLYDAVTTAANGTIVASPKSGIALPIPSKTDADLAAWVLPLDRGLRNELAAHFAAKVAVFVRELGDTSPFPGELFVRRYGITPAECRVLMMLTQGMTPSETANALGISEATVRTHMRSLFAKTGTQGQADLMRLAMSALAPASS
jgi:DNA-binding CsgD family transcriptional regulator/PAS domain-containing protein